MGNRLAALVYFLGDLAMTPALREDAADEAQANLAEIEGIKADLALAVSRMDRLIKLLPGDLCGHVEDAASMVQDDVMNGSLFLAEQALREEVNRIECAAERRHERESAPVVL